MTLNLSPPDVTASSRLSAFPEWAYERIICSGDEFFDGVETAIRRAERTIDCEMYIFANDVLGQRIFAALQEAAARGVVVRILIDGVGSPLWGLAFGRKAESSGIQWRYFHEVPFARTFVRMARSAPRLGALELCRRINNRNHRKMFLIDRQQVWTGGMNVWNVHLESVDGEKAWRDTGIVVEGGEVSAFRAAFELAWASHRRPASWRSRKSQRALAASISSGLVRFNATRRQRKESYRELRRELRAATRRVWITTPYFVPPRPVLRLLRDAARRGVDVRVLFPRRSDVFFLPWVSTFFYEDLISRGVRVFEYLPRMLHAKVMIVDDWMLVGSSNFNHRSLLHDLEADVVVTKPESKERLVRDFFADMAEAEEVLDGKCSLSMWQWCLASVVSRFQRYL